MKSSEHPQTKSTRQRIVLLLAAFVAVFGVPLFLYTTSIHRADLPHDSVDSRASSFHEAIRFNVPVFVRGGSDEFISSTQKEIDQAVQNKFGLGQTWSIQLKAAESVDVSKNYTLQLIHGNDKDQPKSQNLHYSVPPATKAIYVYSRTGFPQEAGIEAYIASVLLDEVFGEELKAISAIIKGENTDVVFPYSTTYNVVFNLFVEDGKAVDWEIDHAVKFIQPVLDALSGYCDFKVSTQIHYYSKLHNEAVYDEAKKAYVIAHRDLSTFINYGEWNLNTHDISPAINFMIYFSDSNYKQIPLLVEDSTTNSFLIPQWGGVYVYNPRMPPLEGSAVKIGKPDMEHIFDIFASQLFELIGVPKSPKSPLARIESFYRIATLKNLKRSLDNLTALLKLSNSLNGISIPESTKSNVLDALSSYDDALASLEESDFYAAVSDAARSVEKSDKAFFEKEMVQQAYFPSEHKLAVFSPLLGPLCSIVIFGLVKTLKSWKNEKNEKPEEEESKKDI